LQQLQPQKSKYKQEPHSTQVLMNRPVASM
jgi:hypothetical protein